MKDEGQISSIVVTLIQALDLAIQSGRDFHGLPLVQLREALVNTPRSEREDVDLVRGANQQNSPEHPAAVERDAMRYRWLRDHMTHYNTDESVGPVLAEVSARIWYHATDDLDYPLDEVIDKAIGYAPSHGREEDTHG